MNEKPCDQCQAPMQPVYTAAEGMKLRGWYCVFCGHFDQAIRRERKFRRNQ